MSASASAKTAAGIGGAASEASAPGASGNSGSGGELEGSKATPFRVARGAALVTLRRARRGIERHPPSLRSRLVSPCAEDRRPGTVSPFLEYHVGVDPAGETTIATNSKMPGQISSEEYERLGELGVLPPSGVELIDGKIVSMSPRGDRHFFVVSELNEIFCSHPKKNYRVCCESLSLQALPKSTPDPDIALARLGRSYAKRRPQPGEIALIIEVADTSYSYDTEVKKKIYAKAGIPEYWVFDIRAGRAAVLRYAQPVLDDYLLHDIKTARDTIAPRECPAVVIDLSVVFSTGDDEAER
jgi:Uma2 family endonuclease